jgi:hypothetical protein
MTNTVLIKRSGTANSIPLAGNISLGELAINYNDGNLFYKDAGGTVRTLASTQFVSVAGNVTGANINTSGNVSATGNVSGNYFIGNGSQLTGITASAGAAITNGTSNVTVANNSNVTVGITGNTVATFASTGEYVTGLISATGNIISANLNAVGLSLSGNVISAINSTANITTTANISGGNILTSGNIITSGASGNITGANLISATTLSATANVIGGNITTAGLVSATGNVTGNYFIGNGSQLTGLSTTRIFNGTSEANIGTSGGNANITIGGVSNVAVFTTAGLNITGVMSASGNVTGGNIISTAALSGVSLIVDGTVSFNSSTNSITIASNQTSGTIRIGGSSGTGIITLGQSTANQTVDIANGAVATGNVKTVNIGGNGVANSVSNVNIFNSVAGNAFLYVGGSGGTAHTGNSTAAFLANTIVSIANTSGSALSVAGNIQGGNIRLAAGGTLTGSNIIIGVTGAYFTNGALNLGALNSGGATVPNATTFSGDAVRISGTNYNSVADSGTKALASQSWMTGFSVSTAQAPVTYTNLSTLYIAPPSGFSTNVTVTNSWAMYSNGAIGTSGLISATGNVTGGNLITAAAVSAASVSASGNISGGNIIGTVVGNVTGTTVSVTGNITGGNLVTAGQVTATGNVNVTGNVNIGNANSVSWANATGIRAYTYYNNAVAGLDTVFL